MKITNSKVIKNGEQELIDAIVGDLDWGVMDDVFKNDNKLEIGEDVEYRFGDIVVHNNQVAYRLEFDVKVTLSIIVDREGNCLTLESSQGVNGENEVNESIEPLSADSEDGPSSEEELLSEEEPIRDEPLSTPFPEEEQEGLAQVASDVSDLTKEMGVEI